MSLLRPTHSASPKMVPRATFSFTALGFSSHTSYPIVNFTRQSHFQFLIVKLNYEKDSQAQ
jgi:hypothetical protein